MAYNYIDNGKFTAAVIAHRLEVLRDREPLWRAIRQTRSGSNRVWLLALMRQHRDPQVPDYLAESFLAIATRMAQKPCFATSPYVDEMISGAVFDCVKAAHKFDSRTSSNAFGYFTRIAIRAFFRVLRAEEKLSSRFSLVDIPESIDFAPPALPEPVSAADVQRGVDGLLRHWVNGAGTHGGKRGWAPISHFEQATIEYLAENPPQAATLKQGAPESVR